MPHCISKNKHNFLSSLDFSLQFLPHRSHNLLPALAVNYNDFMVISSTNLQSHSLRTSPTLLSVCSSRSKRWSSFTRSAVLVPSVDPPLRGHELMRFYPVPHTHTTSASLLTSLAKPSVHHLQLRICTYSASLPPPCLPVGTFLKIKSISGHMHQFRFARVPLSLRRKFETRECSDSLTSEAEDDGPLIWMMYGGAVKWHFDADIDVSLFNNPE